MDQETREFLERKFNAIDARFNAVDGKFETIDARFNAIDAKFEAVNGKFEETRRYFDVVAEGLRGEIGQVAEGVVNLDEKVDREITSLRQEMREGFNEVKSMIKLSYVELDRRVRTLEETVLSLHARLERLEGRQG